MKLSTGLRVGIAACVLSLALTAAYYYGTTNASSVVALPSQIQMGKASVTRSASPAVGSTVGASANVAKHPTTTVRTAAAPKVATTSATHRTTATTAPYRTYTTARRTVVTSVRSSNCYPHSSGSTSGGTSRHGDCW